MVAKKIAKRARIAQNAKKIVGRKFKDLNHKKKKKIEKNGIIIRARYKSSLVNAKRARIAKQTTHNKRNKH